MAEWNENLHPRVPRGQPGGGRWAEKAGGWEIDDDDRDEIAQYRDNNTDLQANASQSEDEKKAVLIYTRGGFYINEILRDQPVTADIKEDVAKKTIADLDKAARPLPENTLLHRAIGLFDLTATGWPKEFEDLKPGDTVSDKAFMSTSVRDLRASIQVSTGGEVIPRPHIKILAGKGSGVIVGDKMFDEIILPRNSRLEYMGEDPSDGSKYFRLQQEGGERPAEDEIPKVPPREADDAGGLRSYLQTLAGFHKQQFPGGKDPASYMLEHGQSFAFDDSSFEGKRGKMHQCYSNAGSRAIDDPDVTYVEGYVSVHGVPIAHAWLVDKKGHVIDPTIRKDKKGGFASISGYFGIPIKSEYLRKTILRTGKWGVLEWPNTEKVMKDDPKDIVADYTQGGGKLGVETPYREQPDSKGSFREELTSEAIPENLSPTIRPWQRKGTDTNKPHFEARHFIKGEGVSDDFHSKMLAITNNLPKQFLDYVKRLHVRYEVQKTTPRHGGVAQYVPSSETGWGKIILYEDMMAKRNDDYNANVIAHEMGHAIDQQRAYSNGARFIKALEADEKGHTIEQQFAFSYYRALGGDWQRMHGEPFAEAVAVIVGPQTRSALAFKKAFPRAVKEAETRLRKRGIIS